MGQGNRLAAVRRTAGAARAQTISRRIHRPHCGQLSAAGGRQGAAAVSANFHCGGEVRAEEAASRGKSKSDIAEAFEKVAGAGQRVMKELLWFAATDLRFALSPVRKRELRPVSPQ